MVLHIYRHAQHVYMLLMKSPLESSLKSYLTLDLCPLGEYTTIILRWNHFSLPPFAICDFNSLSIPRHILSEFINGFLNVI